MNARDGRRQSQSAVAQNNAARCGAHLGVLLDVNSLHDDAVAEPDAVLDHAPWSDGDIRADQAPLADLGRGVDEHVLDKPGARGELALVVDVQAVQVELQPWR